MDLLDQAILEAIHKALDDRVVEDAIDAAIEMLAANHAQRATGRLVIERELAESRAAQQRLIQAIKHSDQPLAALVQELQAEESRARSLEQQVETLADRDRVGALDHRRLAQIVRARAADVKTVLARHTPEARRALRLLLRDRLSFTPIEQDGRRGYRFQGEGTYDGLLSGEAFPLTVVAPRGFGQQTCSRLFAA
jgi:hypothetical protein